jgi:hypothetical protein
MRAEVTFFLKFEIESCNIEKSSINFDVNCSKNLESRWKMVWNKFY